MKKYIFVIFFFLTFEQKVFSDELLTIENQKYDLNKDKQEVNKDKSEIIDRSSKYFALGFGMPGFPSLQFGYRSQHNHNGINLSLQTGTFLIFFANLKADMLYLYYPKPNLKKQTYFGYGLGYLLTVNLVCFGSNHHIYHAISPEFLYGVQYQNKNKENRFIQGQISWPNIFFGCKDGFCPIPQISISYGWLF